MQCSGCHILPTKWDFLSCPLYPQWAASPDPIPARTFLLAWAGICMLAEVRLGPHCLILWPQGVSSHCPLTSLMLWGTFSYLVILSPLHIGFQNSDPLVNNWNLSEWSCFCSQPGLQNVFHTHPTPNPVLSPNSDSSLCPLLSLPPSQASRRHQESPAPGLLPAPDSVKREVQPAHFCLSFPCLLMAHLAKAQDTLRP